MPRGQHGLLRTRYLIGFAGAFWLQCAGQSKNSLPLVWRDDCRLMSPAHHPYLVVRRRSKGAGKRNSLRARHPQQLLQRIGSDPKRRGSEIREADRLECEAWNAIMWAGAM